ncbi:BamA/TamA family outer membrane protein [Albibacterium sp.]|uniref:BamA/TamA family outer membrane protein n=1 Tax=Albibacterium sp. TaxID=2952885 RepID=UPI002CA69906|nr:BamA/TamA family outer membrane protein [Albibacterium sp.]HUH19636.1 BamA/TamA family outer membrane protein [Albibacterium sp.]
MRKLLLFLIFFFVGGHIIFAQNKIENRVILIGDAGELNFKQETIIPRAADLIIKDKTTVFYLGDNIYPRGLGLPGSEEEEESKEILRSQYAPMRANGAPVYFIPGNHDWDRMGELGLEKIVAQSNFLASQQDSLLKMIPANGCPDPIEITISDQLVVIAYDSEWWLFPYEKENLNADCDCTTETEVLDRMEELLYKNRDKTILLASHHPFISYGVHGGHYSLKDHLFPLTVLDKNLYIPLPGLGSLYPLLRTTVFLNPEDMPHPEYKRLIKEVTDVFDGFPNVIYAAGHEHGLQFIKDDDKLNYQIVSGAGSKSSYVKNDSKALFTSKMQGFVTFDMMDDRSSKVTFYEYENNGIEEAFSYTIPYKKEEFIQADLIEEGLDVDSMIIRPNAEFDQVSNFHRKLFGENYRKEWAAETKVPVIRISEIEGGLTPLKRGGGMQTTSLRMEDKTGKQWVLRSVNKNSEALLPAALHDTFAEDFLDDAVSAQHPFSALMVPPIANAAGVPATNPVIGIVAPDKALGVHNLAFANKLVLLEEREPLGDSDNTIKMLEKVYNDNDDTFGGKTFLRARMLDLLIGDWDRHEDQFRWFDELEGKDKDYRVVPRDRDQVIRLMDGIFPRLTALSWVMPTNQGFSPEIRKVNYELFKSSFLNSHPKMQFNYDEWMSLSREFANRVTDSVLEESVRRLPQASYEIRHNELLSDLKQRRDAIPENMEEYYRFINSIVDIRLSNKNELVKIEDANNGLRVIVNKINKEGEVKKVLMDKVYTPEFTKEIRIYLANGEDSVVVNSKQTSMKIRIIGGSGHKDYVIENADKKIKLYDYGTHSTFSGQVDKFQKYISTDSSHTAFVPVNLYNVTMPLITAGYNADDGIMLGGGFKYTHQRGFRKTPFTHTQQLLASASLSTGSFKFDYKGRWREAFGKADFMIDASAYVPNNTQNYFGLGNSSVFDKENHDASYYRARFNLYGISPALGWIKKESSISIGTKFQYYSFNPADNTGRFINNSALINSYDSVTVDKDKVFVGLTVGYKRDNRNNVILPTGGGYFNLDLQAYKGLNEYSKSFAQLTAEFAFYKSYANNRLILANRTGAGATIGKTTFYQALYLGGQGNLKGFRNYRFAGEHLLYNNFEARIKLAEIGSYIIPGQLGLIGFYDVGKVWAKGYNSSTIHQGVGGGAYFSPAQMLVFQVVAGHSKEGWLPYFSLGFRF